jgi:hypothetical protein
MTMGTYSSWAIQVDPEELDQKFWQRRNVEVIDMPLEQYVTQLRERLFQDSVLLGSPEHVQFDDRRSRIAG